jgi:hypothetical protein
MAIVTFSKPVSFPTAPLREMLQKYLPLYRWQCGEADTGSARQMDRFQPHDLVVGRSEGSVVFTELTATLGKLPRGPASEWYLTIGSPTTDRQPIADRIVVLICAIIMIPDEHGARCQLVPDGPWLDASAMPGVVKAVVSGSTLADAAATAPPAPPLATRDAPHPMQPRAPRIDPAAPDRSERVLPLMLVLAERMVAPPWEQIAAFARELDPDGGWQHRGGMVVGRGTCVSAQPLAEPAPPEILQEAFSRSFWFEGDRAAVARHRAHLAIGSIIDTATADYAAVREVAKVISLAIGMTARLPGVVAVVNAATGTIFEPDRAAGFLGFLGRGELPVALWTWTKPHSMEAGNICLSTSGMVPFVGHEVELWNAPLEVDAANAALSDVLRYLLNEGPVIGHGNTCGQTSDQQSIRCFLAPSRAGRAEPVKALFLEFGEEADGRSVTPRPDAIEPAKAPMNADGEAVLRDFVARVGPRDITGMSDIIRDMLAENEAAKASARAVANPPLDPKLADAERLLAELKQDADGKSAEAIEAMQQALRDPSSRAGTQGGSSPIFDNLMKLIHHEQETGALPKPISPPSPAPPLTAPSAGFGRRAGGGFGRKGI